jgi:DNA-directed RNA polymerase subunit RPC12/RpoP
MNEWDKQRKNLKNPAVVSYKCSDCGSEHPEDDPRLKITDSNDEQSDLIKEEDTDVDEITDLDAEPSDLIEEGEETNVDESTETSDCGEVRDDCY